MMMQNFVSFLPTRIIFGNGKFATLGEEAARLGKRALIVTYPSPTLGEYVVQAVEMLQKNGVSSAVFDEVESNPSHTLINRGGAVARQEGCDLVIGLGGGSAIDAAKGIAVTATEEEDIWKIFEGTPITRPTLPVIAVSTTAGTGSEATFFTVISHRELHRKEGFARPQFYPTLSLVDPLLTLDLPPEITAATGMDALSHAIEACYCKMSTPVVDALAASAIRLVAQNLRRAVYDGKDLSARYNMMLANTLAGMAITQSDSCLAHVIGEAVGGVYNTGHGVSVAVCLPATMEYNCVAELQKFADIALWMGEDTRGLTLRQAAMKAPGAVRDLIHDLSMPKGLAALGVNDLSEVVALVNRPGMDASSPRPVDRQTFDRLLQACISSEMSYWALGGN
jgi:alcohol dehydrogenase